MYITLLTFSFIFVICNDFILFVPNNIYRSNIYLLLSYF